MININRTKESIQNILIFISDAMAVFIAYYISGFIWLCGYRGLGTEYTNNVINSNIVSIIVAVLLTALFCNIKGDILNRGRFEEFISVIQKSLITSAIIAVYELLSKTEHGVSRSVYVITFFVGILFMYLFRMLIKKYIKYRNSGEKTSRVIVVTLKDRVKDTMSKVVAKSDWMKRLDGIIIMDEDMTGNEIENIPVIANIHTMMTYIKNEIVDEVYIDVDYKIREQIKPMVMELEDMGVIVNLKLEILDSYKNFDCKFSYIGSVPVVVFANRIYDWKGMFVKRCMDIVGSLVGLVFMGLAMIFVAPAIKIESKGPVFFKQRRVGKNGRYFYIYKFRSMYIDAEERKKELMAKNEMAGLMFKIKDDPRITKVGKFIRKTSIDELPQFINVLKGDMSLVGTRPPTVGEFKQYEGHHKRRLSMKPGITGMWQAYGRKTVFNFEDIVRMDLDYIDNWSILLDIKILFKTVQSVLTVGGQ